MEFLHWFLGRHFTGKVVASRNVSVFLGYRREKSKNELTRWRLNLKIIETSKPEGSNWFWRNQEILTVVMHSATLAGAAL